MSSYRSKLIKIYYILQSFYFVYLFINLFINLFKVDNDKKDTVYKNTYKIAWG